VPPVIMSGPARICAPALVPATTAPARSRCRITRSTALSACSAPRVMVCTYRYWSPPPKKNPVIDAAVRATAGSSATAGWSRSIGSHCASAPYRRNRAV
jgi:hypothetical protein